MIYHIGNEIGKFQTQNDNYFQRKKDIKRLTFQ